MPGPNNNGFIAAIVEQTGGMNKGSQLSNDAPTIIEKYQTPMAKARMETPEMEKPEMEMSSFLTEGYGPELYLNDEQLPSANGLKVGDKVCLMIEAEVINYSFNENKDGKQRQEYQFKLTEGRVDKEMD